MRWCCCAWIVLGMAGVCIAQEDPAQLKKMYLDTLNQLKQAQDRKSALAKENETLSAKTADLQKQLDAAKTQLAQSQAQLADTVTKSYDLRAESAAWHGFLLRYPDLTPRWEVFLAGDPIVRPPGEDWIDRQWPLPAKMN